MSLSFGPRALSFTPTSASDVTVTLRDTDTPATLSSPVFVDGQGRVSFTAASAGRYTVSISREGTTYELEISLAPDVLDLSSPGKIKDAIRTLHAGGGASRGPVKVETGNEARPEDDIVIWRDVRDDQSVAPVNMGIYDIWITGEIILPDTEDPSVPTGLASSSITADGFTLTWDASTDDTAVTEYDVRIDGGTADTVAATPRSYTFSGLTAETLYTAEVRARDAAENVSAYASLAETTAAEEPPSGDFSIYGASAPTGTWTLETDGTPSIVFGRGFYKFTSGDATNGLPNGRVVGGRVWIPVGATGLPTEVTFTLFGPNANLDSTVIQTKAVSMSGVTAGSWVEGMFDTPQSMGSDGAVWVVAAQFTGGTAGKYVFGTDTRPDGDAVVSLSGKHIAWMEAEVLSSPFRIGTGAPGSGGVTASYGVDILVDAGV